VRKDFFKLNIFLSFTKVLRQAQYKLQLNKELHAARLERSSFLLLRLLKLSVDCFTSFAMTKIAGAEGG